MAFNPMGEYGFVQPGYIWNFITLLTVVVESISAFIAISMIDDVVTGNEELCTGCKIYNKICHMRAPYEVGD